MHSISSKMRGLAIDETIDSQYDASGTAMEETTQMTIEQSDGEGEMHETMVIIDEDDSEEEEDEDEEADVQVSEDSPSFIRQATPYPKSSKPMSASSSFKGTPHPSSRTEKPSSVKSVRSVVSNKISGTKTSRSRAGSKASYRSGGGAESLINYDLADLSSGDETDNEECPKKPVPSWAQNSQVGPITVVLRNMLSDEQRERYFGRIELPARDALFTYKDKARKKTLKEAPLDWHSPLSNPRSANSRYLQMLEEVKARNAGANSLKRDK